MRKTDFGCPALRELQQNSVAVAQAMAEHAHGLECHHKSLFNASTVMERLQGRIAALEVGRSNELEKIKTELRHKIGNPRLPRTREKGSPKKESPS